MTIIMDAVLAMDEAKRRIEEDAVKIQLLREALAELVVSASEAATTMNQEIPWNAEKPLRKAMEEARKVWEATK